MWQIWTILGPARRRGPARQGDLPGRPRRGVRVVHGGVPVRRGRHDHRREAGVPGDLDRRGHVEAQQALPVRHLDDDDQQPGGADQVRSSGCSSSTFPDDLRPGRLSRIVAHFSTAVEGLVPLVLFFSHGGWPTAIAAFVMLCFHFGILSAIPMGVPLEWNVFMMFSVLALFVGHADIGLGDLTSPWPIVLFAVVAGTVVLGNLFPRKVSFLPGMRYYAGNWDTTQWCMKPSAEAEDHRRASSRSRACPQSQMEKFYGSPEQRRCHAALGLRVPRVQHPRPGDVHPRAPRDGGRRRGRLRPHRRGADRAAPRSAGTSATATCTTSS